MKLFLASLALLSSSIASVSAYYNIPCPNDGTCCMFKHMDADGEIKLKFTDHSPEILDYQALAATTLGYFSMGPVTDPGVPCSIDPNMNPCDSDPCSAYSFDGLEFDECDWDQHKDGDGILLSVSHECEYNVPTETVCTKTFSFDDDGKKASITWKTSEEPITTPVIRNLRAGRRLSGIELGVRTVGSCEAIPCTDKCPESLTENGITYTRDSDTCADKPERGRCTYTNLDYTNDTDENTDEDEDLPCVDVCVIKNKSIKQECVDPTTAAACDNIGCYVGQCIIDDCNALCPDVECSEELGGIDDLELEGYECNDPVEDNEEPNPKKELTSTVCWQRDENAFEEVILGVVVDESRNTWRVGGCLDPQNAKFFCKKFPMVYVEDSLMFACGPSR